MMVHLPDHDWVVVYTDSTPYGMPDLAVNPANVLMMYTRKMNLPDAAVVVIKFTDETSIRSQRLGMEDARVLFDATKNALQSSP